MQTPFGPPSSVPFLTEMQLSSLLISSPGLPPTQLQLNICFSTLHLMISVVIWMSTWCQVLGLISRSVMIIKAYLWTVRWGKSWHMIDESTWLGMGFFHVLWSLKQSCRQIKWISKPSFSWWLSYQLQMNEWIRSQGFWWCVVEYPL